VNQAARIISYIFHPLLMAFYWVLFLALVMPSGLEPFREESHPKLMLLIFIITFMLPLVVVTILKNIGLISSLVMVERKERLGPFTFLACWYVFITFLLYSHYHIAFYDNLMKFMLIINALIIISTVITLFYKVSIHSVGMWGYVGMVMALCFLLEDIALIYALPAFVLLAGVVMSARLQLRAHNFSEVLAGSIVGFAVGLVGTILLF
jgi:hypothetical protein